MTSSVISLDPYRDVGGRQGVLHGNSQVIADRIQVHGVFQPGRERGHHLVGVVPGPVEATIHPELDPVPQRIEQRRRYQRGGGHGHRGLERQQPGGQQDQGRVQPDEHSGDDGVGDGAGDDPVYVIQVVFRDREGNVPASPMTVATLPAMSHLSWARRSPVARRQLRI